MKYKLKHKLFGIEKGLIFNKDDDIYIAKITEVSVITLPAHMVENRPEFEKVEDNILDILIKAYDDKDSICIRRYIIELKRKLKEDKENVLIALDDNVDWEKARMLLENLNIMNLV